MKGGRGRKRRREGEAGRDEWREKQEEMKGGRGRKR